MMARLKVWQSRTQPVHASGATWRQPACWLPYLLLLWLPGGQLRPKWSALKEGRPRSTRATAVSRKGGAHQQALAQAVLRVAPGRAHQRECEMQHLAALLDAICVAGGGGRLVICIELAQDGVQRLVARRREWLVGPPVRGRWGRARADHACDERPGGARVPHSCPALVCRPGQAERCLHEQHMAAPVGHTFAKKWGALQGLRHASCRKHVQLVRSAGADDVQTQRYRCRPPQTLMCAPRRCVL